MGFLCVVLPVLELALVVGRADLRLRDLPASASFHVGIKGMYHHHLTCDPLILSRDCLCGQGFGDTPWSLVGSTLVNTTEENDCLSLAQNPSVASSSSGTVSGG